MMKGLGSVYDKWNMSVVTLCDTDVILRVRVLVVKFSKHTSKKTYMLRFHLFMLNLFAKNIVLGRGQKHSAPTV